MILLTAESLAKSYADRTLFDDLSFGVHRGERIGLIGVNGSGKSTLLRLVAGLEPPDSGRLTRGGQVRVAYLPQNPAFTEDQSVLDYVFGAETPTMRLLRDYETLTVRLAHAPDDAALIAQLHALSAEMERLDGWEMETTARTILSKLGVEDVEARLATLSGGQRKRVAMARALLDPADLLLLDEPTNHLDVETVAWLEDYLARWPGALLLVTHDRYFLDRVTNRIFELEGKRLHSYEGNYETFLSARAERERLTHATTTKQANLLRKEMAWLLRGARARSTKQKAHIQRIEALRDTVEGSGGPRQELTIALGSRRLGKRVIEAHALTKRWEGECVLDEFSYIFEPGARIGIVGPNGAGKSTLLNLLAGRIEPDSGTVEVGETVHLAYYDQESSTLPLDKRVLDFVQEGAQLIRLADGTKVSASGMLEWFLFPPEQQYSLIGKLSGGEKRRLYLLRTLMEQPNVLLLDEPTNDLDIQTLTVLEDFLDEFPGTLIAVSHDRYFLDRVADHILAFEEGGQVRAYPGNYSLYRERREAAPREQPAPEAAPPTATPTLRPDDSARKLSWKEARELEQLEARIAELEEQLPTLEAAMASAATDYERLVALQREHEAASAELEQRMERWLALSERG